MTQHNALFAGAGKARITYPDGFFPYRGFRGRRFTGIHDQLHARALYLEQNGDKALLISIELGDITDEWVPEISRLTGIPGECIWLTATHTHEAPYANSTWGELIPDEDKTAPFCERCLNAVLSAAEQAIASCVPVSVRCGESSAYVNVNRDHKYTGNQPGFTAPYVSAKNPQGYSDHTVSVLRFDDEQGRTIAYLTGYAVHSSMLFRQCWDDCGGMLISSDLSGAAMNYVESRSDAISLHLLGAAGDQDPRFSTVHSVFDRDGNMLTEDYGDAGYALVDALASELGESILRAGKNAVPVPGAPLRMAKAAVSVRTKEKWEGGPPMSLPAGYSWILGEYIDLSLYMFRLGTLAIMGIPGELVASVGTQLKNTIISAGFDRSIVVTQCNGAFQYISDDFGYLNKTFEATQSHFAPGIGNALESGAVKLARLLLNATVS